MDKHVTVVPFVGDKYTVIIMVCFFCHMCYGMINLAHIFNRGK